MPVLSFAGTKLRGSSDTFVYCSIILVILRIVALGLICTDIYGPYDSQILRIGYFGCVVMSCLHIIIYIILLCISATGTIMDIRRDFGVSLCLILLVIAAIVELTTYSLFAVGYLYHDKEKAYSMSFFLTSILTCANTTIIFLELIALFFSDNLYIWSLYYKNDPTMVSTMQKTVQMVWERRVRCLLCCMCKTHAKSKAFKQFAIYWVSNLIATFLADLDLTLSDVNVGIALLGQQSRYWMPDRGRPSIGYLLDHTIPCGDKKAPGGTFPPKWLRLKILHRISLVARAMYDWPIQCLMDPCRTCCAIRFNGPSYRKRPIPYPKPIVKEGYMEPRVGCCFCRGVNSKIAYILDHTKIAVTDILFISKANDYFETPFAIVVLHDIKRLVVVIRGSCSTKDFITDIVCIGEYLKPEEIPPDLENKRTYFIHAGVLRSARTLYRKILETGLIDYTISQVPDEYMLAVTGHSLGAGVAIALTIFLKNDYPNVKAYAFSPPLGLMDESLAEYTKSIAVSVSYGHDVVARMSYRTMEDLKWRLWTALCRCPRPKYQMEFAMFIDFLRSRCTSSDKTLVNRILHRDYREDLEYAAVFPENEDEKSNANINNMSDDQISETSEKNKSAGDESSENMVNRLVPKLRAHRRNLFNWLRTDYDSSSYLLEEPIPENYDDQKIGAKEPRTDSWPMKILMPDRCGGITFMLADTKETIENMEEAFYDDMSSESSGTVKNSISYYVSRKMMKKRIPVALLTNEDQLQTIITSSYMFRDHFPNRISKRLERMIALQKFCKDKAPKQSFPLVRIVSDEEEKLSISLPSDGTDDEDGDYSI